MAGNHAASRARLAVLAVAGDLGLSATQVLPWAAPIIVGALFVNRVIFYWLAAGAVLLLAWMLRPSFRVGGRAVAPSEAPQLFHAIEALQKNLRVPGRLQVNLDGSFNASAVEVRGLFGLVGTRRILTLGVPLLAALSAPQALAVVAHELGHFSRRHGRLGHWLYRARVGWLAYAQSVDEADTVWDKAAAWYAGRFVPRFTARTFAYSRQCEYEADADAASVVGASVFADALTCVCLGGWFWEDRLPQQLADEHSQRSEPPSDVHAHFVRYLQSCSGDDWQTCLAETLRAPADAADTHPALRERLQALGERPSIPAWEGGAGRAWFGKRWAEIIAAFDRAWAARTRAEWCTSHLRTRYVIRPLVETDSMQVQAWDISRQLAHAKALGECDAEAGLAALRVLHQAHASDRYVTFALAEALLAKGDESGLRYMEELAREHPAFRPAAFSCGAAYFRRRGDDAQAERWAVWLRHVSHALDATSAQCMDALEKGGGGPADLPQAERTVLSEAVRLDPCCARAWLAQAHGALHVAAQRPPVDVTVCVLSIMLHPHELDRSGEDEEEVVQRYRGLLAKLLPPDCVAVVQTCFTTESPPAAFRDRAELALGPSVA